jgi:predicted HTH transcriptional regulator
MDRILWTSDRYIDFLGARRQLLAQSMNDYLSTWIADQPGEEVDESAVRKRISAGESDRLEFKASLRWDRKENRVNKELERVVIKTIAGLLNAKKGGDLLVGVSDSGEIVGLEDDYSSLTKKDRDGFELHLRNLLSRDLGDAITAFLTVTFHELDGQDVCQITVEPCDHPVYVTEAQISTFFLRVGNGTNPLPVKEAVRYVQTRWGGAS